MYLRLFRDDRSSLFLFPLFPAVHSSDSTLIYCYEYLFGQVLHVKLSAHASRICLESGDAVFLSRNRHTIYHKIKIFPDHPCKGMV